LAPLLVLLVLAKLAGQDTPSAMAEWVALRAASLKAALGLDWKRMPHPSTYRRLLQRGLDLQQLEALAGQFLASLGQATEDLLNLDGKTLRGTIPAGQTQGLHLLALQQAGRNLVLAQQAVASHENEISAAPALLRRVELRGKLVTGDALLAQQALSRQIVEAGGDYLWVVKENQPSLRAYLAAAFTTGGAEVADRETAQSLEKGHGRIECRSLTTSAKLTNTLEWPYLEQAFVLRRTRTACRTQHRSEETVYGITSLGPLENGPERLLALTRGHWGIENGLHYRRDVTFREDRCRMKSHTAAQALAVFNNLAIGLIRHAGWENAAAARRFYGAHLETALSLILAAPT
jgi:predicted transposase YbfD/YdcC